MLPHLPLELWHRILDFTCTEDDEFNCTSSLALSRTCHTLRHASQYHRYHSVTLHGLEQLCAFEEQFNCNSESLSQPEQGVIVRHGGIVHLNMKIENLWNVAYPKGEEDNGGIWWDARDDTYIPSDSEEGDGELLNNGGDDDGHGSYIEQGEGDDAGIDHEGDLTDEEVLEFSELSRLESQEIAYDAADLAKEELGTVLSLADGNAQVLSYLLAGRPTAIARLEFRVYSALRRLLEACAPTLQVLTLSWNPMSTFFLEAIFPVLPVLRVLRWQRDMSYYHLKFEGTIKCERKTEIPVLFPALRRLEVMADLDHRMIRILKDLVQFGPGLRTLSVPQDSFWYAIKFS